MKPPTFASVKTARHLKETAHILEKTAHLVTKSAHLLEALAVVVTVPPVSPVLPANVQYPVQDLQSLVLLNHEHRPKHGHLDHALQLMTSAAPSLVLLLQKVLHVVPDSAGNLLPINKVRLIILWSFH